MNFQTRITQDFVTDPAYMELMDAGKRIADEYAMHRLADPIGNIGRVFAVRLQDGSPEPGHTLYPDRVTARRVISKHDDEDRWMYIQIVPSTLPPRDAAIMLRGNRKLYDAGIRGRTMGGRVMIPRVAREDQIAQLRSIFRGTPPTNVRGG
jgi:hypothetical protein